MHKVCIVTAKRGRVGGIRPTMDPSNRIEVFFDGGCPLCKREVAFLRRLDRRRGLIQFTDIDAPDFDTATLGRTQEQLMAEIHGRLPSGSLVTGVEVFRQLYSAVGWGRVVALTRFPGIRQACEWAYMMFAKNRLRITGRCASGSCAVHPRHGLAR